MFERPRPQMGTEGDVLLRRIAAFLIDAILLSVASGIVAAALRSQAAVGIIATVLLLAYFTYFEGEYGQTLGKMALDIVVVTEDGEPCTYWAAAIRTILRIIDGFPGSLYLIGLAVIFYTDRNQRVGDVVADTVVVREAPVGGGEGTEPDPVPGAEGDQLRV